MMRRRLALGFLLSLALVTSVFAADTLTTFSGAGVSGAITAAYRAGYQTWEIVRGNFNTLNDIVKTGTGTPESAVVATVGSIYRQTDGADCTAIWEKATGSGNTGWKALSTASCTETLTNHTLDAEGTGNVVTLPFTEYWAGVTGWNAHTATTDAPTDTTIGSVVSLYHVWRFDDSATESINRQFLLPADWTSTLDLTIYWNTTATSGNVVWQVATICVADNETMDPSTFTYNTAQTVTDASKASASLQNAASISTLTTTGCAAGELLVLKIFRDPTHVSDTLANNADFIGAKFTYRRAL